MPKSARAAMAGQAVKGPHLEADLLNAYAERNVTALESQQIANHLATCVDCREAVFLANNAVEVPEAVIEQPLRGVPVNRWRWLMPATALLAVAVAFTALRQTNLNRPAPTPQVAMRSADSSATKAAPEKTETYLRAEQAKPATSDKAAAKTTQKRAISRNVSAPPPPVTSPAAKLIQPLPAEKASPQIQTPAPIIANRALARSAGVSSAALDLADANTSDQTEASAAAKNTTVTNSFPAAYAANVQNSNNMVRSGPMQRMANNYVAPASAQTVVEVQSAAPLVETAAAEMPQQELSMRPMALDAVQKQKTSLFRTSMRWRVSAQGYLERLVDGAWKPAMSSMKRSYRTVAVMGSHVWAGGSGPEIVHSTDDGNTWATIRIGEGKEPPTANVKAIRADDPWHVAVMIDDGNTWTSADGGQTWSKQ